MSKFSCATTSPCCNEANAVEDACLVLTDKQEVDAPASPRQVNVDLSRTTSRQQPMELPSAASTPQKHSLRKTASALSPRKNAGKRLYLFACPWDS